MANVIIFVALLYALLLFIIAFLSDRAQSQGRGTWLRSPIVYTLSLSVYCTAWTFYGAVGSAARSGLEYLTIYIGPTIVVTMWWWFLRKLADNAKMNRVSSIADLISSLYGKSNNLAAGVTFLAVLAVTPYISLQLQSVSLSFALLAGSDLNGQDTSDTSLISFWLTLGLIAFTVLFGTRNLDANERQQGVVTAIAVEAVVKLCALIAVGVFVVWGMSDGPMDVLQKVDQSDIATWTGPPSRWFMLIALSAAAFITLPRMFQVMIVENDGPADLRTASWLFPGYLMLMSLFVVPIAVVGTQALPEGANPDLFVLSLPLAEGQQSLAILSFIGGFSSATSMVIVASIALSIMISNHIFTPLWLRYFDKGAALSGDIRGVVLASRRVSIGLIISLGYVYYRLSGGGESLAAIGLISFSGVSQFLPAILGGLFWKQASRTGTIWGIFVGSLIWMVTLLLPGVIDEFAPRFQLDGQNTWGVALFHGGWVLDLEGGDPLVNSVVWSLGLNTFAFVVGSYLFPDRRVSRDVPYQPEQQNTVSSEQLLVLSQRILGNDAALALFSSAAQDQGGQGYLPHPDIYFRERLEKELAGSVGVATAHAMLARVWGDQPISVQDLMAVADETAKIREYSNRLEQQSETLGRTAQQLQEANERLTELSEQKDAFLSQISHELRTPMTSIRSFSEILRDERDLDDGTRSKFANTIISEAERLTRMLDELLQISVLENASIPIYMKKGDVFDVIQRAVLVSTANLHIDVQSTFSGAKIETDLDWLEQVFINLISNADKYCDADDPNLVIRVDRYKNGFRIDFIDNGTGIEKAAQRIIFEKFARVNADRAGGAGLGLAISREIMKRLGGDLNYLPGQGGTAFRVDLPQ